jgi:hypothetical protein
MWHAGDADGEAVRPHKAAAWGVGQDIRQHDAGAIPGVVAKVWHTPYADATCMIHT